MELKEKFEKCLPTELDCLIKKELDSMNIRITNKKNTNLKKEFRKLLEQYGKTKIMDDYICCYCNNMESAIARNHLGCIKMIYKIDGRIEMTFDNVKRITESIEILDWLYEYDEERIVSSFNLIGSFAKEEHNEKLLAWLNEKKNLQLA
jgi:hypothetical protein